MPVGCLTDNSGERLNGIQEVSGSIPLISTRRIMIGLISSEIKPFCFPKIKIGMMLAASTAVQATSLLLKRPFPRSKDRESGLFCCPEMCLTVRHIIHLGKHAPQRCNKRAKVLISANIFTKVLYKSFFCNTDF